jgi:hypothetical protein
MMRNSDVMLGQMVNDSAEFCNFAHWHFFVKYLLLNNVMKVGGLVLFITCSLLDRPLQRTECFVH